MSTPATFSALLDDRLRSDPGRPLVTFYDEATGERVELSVVTYANWVAKTASLLVDEHGLERGDTLRVDLPVHWLTTVFLGAAWQAGLVVSDTEQPRAVVTGPEGVERWAASSQTLVLACSLLPLGVRFADALPAGVHDVGVEVWSQPDSFIPWDPATPEDAAWQAQGSTLTQQQLWEAAAAGAGDPATSGGDRLLSETNPASPSGLLSFTGPLARGGSVVLVTHAGPDRLAAIAAAERVADRFPR